MTRPSGPGSLHAVRGGNRLDATKRARSRSRSCDHSRNRPSSLASTPWQEDEDLRTALAMSEADCAKVATLVSMGISDPDAREALEATGNNLYLAIDHALTRNLAQYLKPIQDVGVAIDSVEKELEELQTEAATTSEDRLARMADQLTSASCTLDNLNVQGNPELCEARRVELNRCSLLESKIAELRHPKSGHAIVSQEISDGGDRVSLDNDEEFTVDDEFNMIHEGSRRCFPPDTVFKMPNALLVRADSLALGDCVLDPDGEKVEVTSVVTHPCQPEQLVELVTTTSIQLRVTASHRVLIPCTRGREERLAKKLSAGDWVICGKTAVQLESVNSIVVEMSVVELQFENDAAVEAFPVPLQGVVTKGQALVEALPVLSHCKEEMDEAMDDVSAGASTMPPSDGSLQECTSETDDTAASVAAGPRAPRSGRSRTRLARFKASLRRLPSPDGENL